MSADHFKINNIWDTSFETIFYYAGDGKMSHSLNTLYVGTPS